MTDKATIIIAVDDVHPEQGWGCEDDQATEYLEELNKEYGCKFTFFVPSCYHKKFYLSEYRDWITYWKSKDWVELAAHGHYHMCEQEGIGECEFLELTTEQEVEDRLAEMFVEWAEVGHMPRGWKNPGWVVHPNAVDIISKYFDYVALHDNHNNNLIWNTKMLFGYKGINESSSIDIINDTIMFQSHIAGEWNDNRWNDENYEHFRLILNYLEKEFILKYKTMAGLI